MLVRLNGANGNLPIPEGLSILGRGRECALRINDPRLSRQHAKFQLTGTTLTVADNGSVNGVYVNNVRISGPTPLRRDDVVVCGPFQFTVAVDAEVTAAISELLPSPQPTSDELDATVNMEPLTTTAKERGSSGGEHHPPPHDDPSSAERALKPHEDPDPVTSALDSNRRARILLPDASATPTPAPAPPPAGQRQPREKSTGLSPEDFKQLESAALKREKNDPRGPRWAAPALRAQAAALDAMQGAVLVGGLCIPLIACGYAWALSRAGAVMEDGLPRLLSHPSQPAGFLDLATSIFHPEGMSRLGTLIGALYRLDEQGPFLIVFVACTLAAIVAALIVLLGLVTPTMLRGAPYWHRRFGLEIVSQRSERQLDWSRALARWVLFALLLPLAPFGLIGGGRGVHDRLSGSMVRLRSPR